MIDPFDEIQWYVHAPVRLHPGERIIPVAWLRKQPSDPNPFPRIRLFGGRRK